MDYKAMRRMELQASSMQSIASISSFGEEASTEDLSDFPSEVQTPQISDLHVDSYQSILSLGSQCACGAEFW
jgi:hypothetical protein